MENQKKRTKNFSADERRILTELVHKYQEVVENKRTDATTNVAKLKGWIHLAKEFNTISTFCHRTHTVLKCCWENIKRQAKKDRVANKKKVFITGCGKPPSSPLNRESDSIVEAILGPALEGVPNKYDSVAGIAEPDRTPTNLRTPGTKPLKIPKPNEGQYLQRRRPKKYSLVAILIKEKIKLVQILQESAKKEAALGIAILEEQLRQEKRKTQKLE